MVSKTPNRGYNSISNNQGILTLPSLDDRQRSGRPHIAYTPVKTEYRITQVLFENRATIAKLLIERYAGDVDIANSVYE